MERAGGGIVELNLTLSLHTNSLLPEYQPWPKHPTHFEGQVNVLIFIPQRRIALHSIKSQNAGSVCSTMCSFCDVKCAPFKCHFCLDILCEILVIASDLSEISMYNQTYLTGSVGELLSASPQTYSSC